MCGADVVDLGAGWHRTSVFLMLIVSPNALVADDRRTAKRCSAASLGAAIAQSFCRVFSKLKYLRKTVHKSQSTIRIKMWNHKESGALWVSCNSLRSLTELQFLALISWEHRVYAMVILYPNCGLISLSMGFVLLLWRRASLFTCFRVWQDM